MTARGASGRCPPTTWLGPQLLLVCLLVSRSITQEELKHCSHMIGDGHLQLLQQLIDSQMETSCKISFTFVNRDQVEDHVCYIKKAFLLMQDILEETISFKDNTSNANALVKLQELSVRLKVCFPTVSTEQNQTCDQNFSESPLELLEKIKEVFIDAKNFLKEDQNVFSKNCSDSFAKCTPDVVTKPDCNCLYPKATPSSDLASVSPQQPLAPSSAPTAGLTRADSEGTEGRSLLSSEQPLHTVDPGTAKQRPPRSTCQSFESAETPGVEGGPTGSSPQVHPSVGRPVSGMEDSLDSLLSTNWALEEASGEDSEGPEPQMPEHSSRMGGGSVQAKTSRPSHVLPASPFPTSSKGRLPADRTLPKVGPMSPTGQAWSHTPEKTNHLPVLPRDHQELGSARTRSLRPKGLSRPSTLSARPRLPRSYTWGPALPLPERQGKRNSRERRSPKGLERGRASEGAALLLTHFNSVPLTDTGHKEPRRPQEQHPMLALSGGIIMVLLAVGGLLFYSWRWRSHREPQTVDSPMEQPEGSSLTQDEDRQVEMPV